MYIPVLSSCVHKTVSDVESTFKNLHTFQSPPIFPVQRIVFPPWLQNVENSHGSEVVQWQELQETAEMLSG